MKNTVFYLSTCSTCKRILDELTLPEDVIKQDIKTQPLTPEQVDELRDLAGSYEALFSKRAQLYRQRDLKAQNLQEDDFRALLIEHYTFLKRPVFVLDKSIYIGNSKKNVEAVAQHLTTS